MAMKPSSYVGQPSTYCPSSRAHVLLLKTMQLTGCKTRDSRAHREGCGLAMPYIVTERAVLLSALLSFSGASEVITNFNDLFLLTCGW